MIEYYSPSTFVFVSICVYLLLIASNCSHYGTLHILIQSIGIDALAKSDVSLVVKLMWLCKTVSVLWPLRRVFYELITLNS